MSVRESIASAFREVPYPGDDHIALHECSECRQIRDDLRGKSAPVLEDGVLERRCDSLPLLSPAAFHYFVPAYMLYSLNHPDSEVAFFTCQGLGMARFDAERFRLFSLQQKEAAVAFLEFFKSHEREDEDPDIRERQEYQNKIDVAINKWKELS